MTVYYLGYPKHGWDEQETFERYKKTMVLLKLIHGDGTEEDKGFKYNHGNEAGLYIVYEDLLI